MERHTIHCLGECFRVWPSPCTIPGNSYIHHSLDGMIWTQAIENYEKEVPGLEVPEEFEVVEVSVNGVAGDATRLIAVTNAGTFLTSP